MGILRWIALIVFSVWCLALCVFDIRERRLPNTLTLGGALVIAAAAGFAGQARPAFAGAALLFGIYFAVHLVSPPSLGAGDVKLALGTGAVAGMAGGPAWLLAALLAPLAAACAVLILTGLRKPPVVPHGPFMCGATLVAVIMSLL